MFSWLTEDKQDDAQIGTHVLFCVDRLALEDGPQIGSPHFEKYTVRFTVCMDQNLYTTLWAVTPHNKRPFHRPTTTVSVALVVYVHCYCVYRPFVPRLFSEIQITTHNAGVVSK